MRHCARVLAAGLPLVAFLQLVRVYAQSMRRIADAEVRLFHLYVHEPLIRDGVPELEMAEEMGDLAADILPLAAPLTEYLHNRYLRFFIEQDVVGHMESEPGPDTAEMALGQVDVTLCFIDLTGFTRFTEEEGDIEALDVVENFVETVEATLPREATIVKTIGDEVMVVSPDAASLTEWAVEFLGRFSRRPQPRVGIHSGDAVYRDGDYFGSQVNLAHRIVNRALAGEVLVTDRVAEAVAERRRAGAGADRPGRAEGLPGADRAVRRPRRARSLEEVLLERVRAGGLIAPPAPVVAMLSGGRDSVCMLDLAVRARGPEAVAALHVNYGLRPEAEADERHCAELCAELGVELTAERPQRPGGAGNLQAWARDARYAAATRLAEPRGATIVTGHTADDQVETILYRLASSPSRRALLGMRPHDGRLARPLLGTTREETTAYCEARGLAWREDTSNADPAFARSRVRHGLLPELERVHPAAARQRPPHRRDPPRRGRGPRRPRRRRADSDGGGDRVALALRELPAGAAAAGPAAAR